MKGGFNKKEELSPGDEHLDFSFVSTIEVVLSVQKVEKLISHHRMFLL
jgi:hypothetical protein